MAATHEDRNAALSPGVAIKAPCRAATTAAITLSGEQTIDGVACVTGDRVLVKNQTSSIANGIYGVSTGAWAREPDFDGNRDVVLGTFVFITSGATNAGAFYECTTTGTVVFGTSNITFAVGALGPIALPLNLSNTTFTQAGTGATARTGLDKTRDIISVKDFGAVGDGVTDDTAARDAWLLACAGKRGYAPAGTYLVTTEGSIAADRTNIFGDGQQATIWKFAPTATGKAGFHLKKATASLIVQCSIRGMAFDATGNTQGTKSAIRVTDGEEIIIDDVAVSNWTSGATDCIGFQLRGRQTHSISNVVVFSDIPISVEDNPNSIIDIDHYHFWNCYFSANANPVIKIADGVNLSNVTFDGYQAWVAGTHGLFWSDTTTSLASNNLTLKNIRFEQGTSATSYLVSITHNTGLDGLLIENIYGGADRKGFFFRKVHEWEIRNSLYTSATLEALNIDNTTYLGRGTNNFWQTGATATISGLTRIYQWGMAPNTTLASDFLYVGAGYNPVSPAIFGTPLSITGAFASASPRTGTSATDTITSADSSFIANRAGTITLTLQAAASFAGRELVVRTIQAQTVVSDASNVVPLVGGAAGTAILAATAGKWALLKSDGANWQIMAGN